MKTMPILLGYRAKEEIANLRELGALEIVIAIPWELIQPHENQAKANHGGQSLERLREIGQNSFGVIGNHHYETVSYVDHAL